MSTWCRRAWTCVAAFMHPCKDVDKEVDEALYLNMEGNGGGQHVEVGSKQLEDKGVDVNQMQGIMGDDDAGLTTMMLEEGGGSLLGRQGWSMRKWKRQAQGIDILMGHSQRQGVNKKKRKGNSEEVDSERKVEKKKKRGKRSW
jgi:hypothetical protein